MDMVKAIGYVIFGLNGFQYSFVRVQCLHHAGEF